MDVETETEQFLGCRDRDSSRLGNLMDVKTETSQDWATDVDTETPLRLSLISVVKGDLSGLTLAPHPEFQYCFKTISILFQNYFMTIY